MNELKQSRIDYVLCDGEMEGKIKCVYYKEVGLSDIFRGEIRFYKNRKKSRGLSFKCSDIER